MSVKYSLASVAATLAAAFMLHAGVSAAAAPAGCRDTRVVPVGEAARVKASQSVLCLVNRVRAAHRLGAVRLSRPLGTAAMRHSTDMVSSKYFAHDGIGGDDLAARAREAGYPASRTVSETLVWCLDATPDFLARTLMASPPHRRIVLTRRARDIGVGLVLGAPMEGIDGPSATLVLAFGG
ncbi:MAG TPA: CAP domain-containing protein [Solirubrobacteraceae bacterium]|nr:CAP domain-containing protein [Solirubrobacteraceae bacterium]